MRTKQIPSKRIKDLSGRRYGRLTVIGFFGLDKHKESQWVCLCDCGTKKIIHGQPLQGKKVFSCGCLNDEVRRKKHVTEEHIEERKKRNWKDWYARNREKQIKKAIEFSKNNRELWNSRRRKRTAERMNDPVFKLTRNLRSRLRLVLKTGTKRGSAIQDLGCSVTELKNYLESLFYNRKDGTPMNWNNYGRSGWQIDHITPLSTLRQGRTIKELCHYKNLQPLWSEDNIEKRSKDALKFK